MPVISIQTLHCYETEDRRYDDCRLDITPDDEPIYSLRRNLSEGDIWELNREISFAETVSVRLWDEDRRTDDHLGTVRIDASTGPGGVAFVLDGAHYEMAYTVSDDSRSAQEIAWAGLNRSTSPGVWTHISSSLFKSQIEARLENPEIIDQAQAPLCGPTVVVYELARANPARYAQLARELFETGYLPLIGNTIDVPRGLREDNIGGGMAAVDWMFAASLRNNANAVLRVRSHLLGGLRGSSLSGAMMDWSRQLLGMTEVQDISTETGGEMAAIRRAGEVVSSGGHAFLQVEANPLLRGGEDRHHYDHWLPLTLGPFIEGNEIQFGTYSWGATRCVQVDIDTFCESFHGVVIASRP